MRFKGANCKATPARGPWESTLSACTMPSGDLFDNENHDYERASATLYFFAKVVTDSPVHPYKTYGTSWNTNDCVLETKFRIAKSRDL